MSLRARIAAGDRQALGEAFTSYRGLAAKVLMQRGRHPADVDDLIQDAFLLLPSCARKCAPETSLGGCVAAAVIHACNFFDGHASTKRRDHFDVSELRSVADPALTPEEAAEQGERAQHLVDLLELMPWHQREALISRELRGSGTQEIACRLGLTPDAAQHAVTRGRRLLERLAADSPLAEVFAAMPSWGDGGSSRSSRWERKQKSAMV